MPSSMRTVGRRLSYLRGILSNMRPGDVVREPIPPTCTVGTYRIDNAIPTRPIIQYRERTCEDLMNEYNQYMRRIPNPAYVATDTASINYHAIDAMRYYLYSNGITSLDLARHYGRPTLDPILYPGVTMGEQHGQQADPDPSDIQRDIPVAPVENPTPSRIAQGLREAIVTPLVAVDYHGIDIDGCELTTKPTEQASQDLNQSFLAIVHPALIKEITERYKFNNDADNQEERLWRRYMSGINTPHITVWSIGDAFCAQITDFSSWNRELALIGAYLHNLSTMEFARETYANSGCGIYNGSWPEASSCDITRSRRAVKNMVKQCLRALELDWRSREPSVLEPLTERAQVYCL